LPRVGPHLRLLRRPGAPRPGAHEGGAARV